ncbi:MAG: hypothetical protein H6573_19770 [Lewinellaceae bacterium]|nr:hypothetical protein [Phaeodactylibacter sp.]MCB0613375.1 hypothetical protein [Phaeodactylibacter sp.]MCB9349726.1 hypothetical protein [Lewinellaceae bacterium]
MERFTALLFSISLILSACQPTPGDGSTDSGAAKTAEANPASKGFNAADSDERAISIADSVMLAMGGRKAWDNTRFLQWTFFGRRTLLWDKFTGDVRIEIPADSAVYLVNIKGLTGKAREGERTIENPDTLQARLQRANSIWINDSYWLVMPYKLKNSGVAIQYLGQDTTQSGIPAYVLQLTFQEVGDTPENKYHVYVDTGSYLVRQWAYFPKASDEKPAFITPWDDYRKYGDILLSGNRGERGITDIAVLEKAPEGAFTSLAPLRAE